MAIDLSGRTALVTGATGGIGQAICAALAEVGAIVIGTDLPASDSTPAKLWRDAVPGGQYLVLDVLDEKGWASVAEAVGAEHGSLDILVHNAGVVVVKTLEQTDIADLRLLNGVNSEALIIGTGVLLPLLRKAGEVREFGASVITVSSTAGYIGAPLHIGYCASKGAARMFSKACAMEFSARGFNIRCNSVHPGGVDTPMLTQIMERFAEEGFANSADEARAGAVADVPMKRLAGPPDVAKAVRFLASDEAGYVHGTELLVDGGYVAK